MSVPRLNKKWTVAERQKEMVGWATSLLFMTCLCNRKLSKITVSYKNECYCVSRHIANTDTIHNCMQLKLRDLLTEIRSLPNEIKMCRICTSIVSCGSGEIVTGATGEEFVSTLPTVAPLSI